MVNQQQAATGPRSIALAHTKYDLVWEEDGRSVGYKCVVESGVDASALPPALREAVVKDSAAAFLQPRPALKRPLDLVWEPEEGGGGGRVGFKAAVNSRVDPARLPPFLRACVLCQEDTAQGPHEYLPYPSARNPVYSRTSENIGACVGEVTPPKLDRTQVWAGLTGQFTSTFPSEPARSGSLNCSMNRHVVTKGPTFGTTPYFEPRAT